MGQLFYLPEKTITIFISAHGIEYPDQKLCHLDLFNVKMIYSQSFPGRSNWTNYNDTNKMLYYWNHALHSDKEYDKEYIKNLVENSPLIEIKNIFELKKIRVFEVKSITKIIRKIIDNNDDQYTNLLLKSLDLKMSIKQFNSLSNEEIYYIIMNIKKNKDEIITEINTIINKINAKHIDIFSIRPLLAIPIHEKEYHFCENPGEQTRETIKNYFYGMHIIQDNKVNSSVHLYDKTVNNLNNVFSWPSISKDGEIIYFDNKENLKRNSTLMRAYEFFHKLANTPIKDREFGVIFLSEIIDFFKNEGYTNIIIIDPSCRNFDNDNDMDIDISMISKVSRKERKVL